MEQLNDYSMMFAQLSNWSKTKFESELKKYNKQIKDLSEKVNKTNRYISTLKINVNYFKKKIKEIEYLELKKNFVLKPEHKIILQNIEINVDGISGLNYLYDNFIDIVYKKDEYKLSGEEQERLYKDFDKLVKEIPIAIKSLLG